MKSDLTFIFQCHLAEKSGDTIEIVCEGKDEEKALEAMVELVESGIGE